MFQTPDQAPLRGASTPEKPFGFYDATIDGGWTVPGRALYAVHERSAWTIRLVALAHAGRPHQSLGPHLAAQRALRFQTAQPRRPGLRLADLLRGCRALLRQGRAAHRRLRHQRGAGEHAEFLAGMPPAAAGAAGQRLPGAAARAAPGHPHHRRPSRRADPAARFQALAGPVASRQSEGAKDHRAAHAAARGLLLGHRLRPRLLDPRELPVDHRASAAGARDRATSTSCPTPWSARWCWARTGGPRA